MTMSNANKDKREKILLLIAGILAIVVVVPMLFSLYGGSSSAVFEQRNKLRTDVAALETKVERGKQYQRRLENYAKRSLPPLGEAAKDKYRKWLNDEALEAGFKNLKEGANPSKSEGKSSEMKNYSFRLEGQASLAELTKFLHGFYEVDHMHYIKTLNIKPVDQSNRLEIVMVVDTISLDLGKIIRKSPGWTLDMATIESESDLKKLRDSVAGVDTRAFFSVYRPPNQDRPDQGPPKQSSNDITDAMFTFVSGVVEVNGIWQVWIEKRLNGTNLQLSIGDQFDVGGVKCFVREIDFNSIVVGAVVYNEETKKEDEDRITIRVGKCFEDLEEPEPVNQPDV